MGKRKKDKGYLTGKRKHGRRRLTGLRLADIVAAPVVARTSRGDLPVLPLTVKDLAEILYSSPDVSALLDGGSVDPAALIAQSPGVIAEVIARAAGDGGDADVAAARGLAPGDQLAIVSAVFETTFPGGLSSFFAQIEQLAEAVGLLDSAKETPEDMKDPATEKKAATPATLDRLNLPPEAMEA